MRMTLAGINMLATSYSIAYSFCDRGNESWRCEERQWPPVWPSELNGIDLLPVEWMVLARIFSAHLLTKQLKFRFKIKERELYDMHRWKQSVILSVHMEAFHRTGDGCVSRSKRVCRCKQTSQVSYSQTSRARVVGYFSEWGVFFLRVHTFEK